MLSVLADVSRDLPALATSLLRIFRQEKKEIVLIKTVATKEMEQEGEAVVISQYPVLIVSSVMYGKFDCNCVFSVIGMNTQNSDLSTALLANGKLHALHMKGHWISLGWKSH